MIDYAQIQRTARAFAKRLPSWATVDADDLANTSALAAMRGRRSILGPMQDLLRKQGWVTNHRKTNTTYRSVPIIIHKNPSRPSERECGEIMLNAFIDVHSLLRRLTLKQRQAVEMYYLEGMTQQEVALRLRIHQESVSCRISGAFKQMRRMIR